ncbi:MAG: glycosyltransferase family 39 protein, partial [Candidatus Eremiobacteraeota bacterium]|nr:glycosyltransferase family 39 protein [Candidatus Eremiobacteraeota bacterium]
MDVPTHASAGDRSAHLSQRRSRWFALAAILVLAAALRLYGLHNPILDHPGWRQGDEAAIARNFAQLQNDIFSPQVDYDGPPPNYVELELQIVPYLAAQAYRAFGVHEVIARLLVIVFSLATLPLVYLLGKQMYCARAGLIAALLFAIAPGAVYYGRAILPESDMLFFGCAALLLWWRWLTRWRPLDLAGAVLGASLAWLAKPPALLLLIPMAVLALVRAREGPPRNRWLSASLVLSLLPLWLYLGHAHAIAEWHWASGITSKHVLPTLLRELSSPASILTGLQSALALLKMLDSTVLGPFLFGALVLAMFAQPAGRPDGGRSWFFAAWFLALAAYTFAVVNVERVDYYLIWFIPFAVLYAGGAIDNVLSLVGPAGTGGWRAISAGLAALFVVTYVSMLEIHPYYTWSRPVYAAAGELRMTLEPDTLIVMAHYDPSVLYSIGHRGWEEDALLWNVHDMTSAVAKGARYLVAIEVPRFKANKQLYRFMQRYRRVPVRSGWQVYD